MCGQGTDVERVDIHFEDYSEPESGTPICYTCHMMVHTRHHGLEPVYRYRDLLARGACFPGSGGNFGRFVSRYRANDPTALITEWIEPRGPTWLHDLPDTEEDRNPFTDAEKFRAWMAHVRSGRVIGYRAWVLTNR